MPFRHRSQGKRSRTERVGREKAVGQDAVVGPCAIHGGADIGASLRGSVRIEVQRRAEALKEGDRTGLSVGNPQGSTALALPRKENTQENCKHLAENFWMSGESVAQVERGSAPAPSMAGPTLARPCAAKLSTHWR